MSRNDMKDKPMGNAQNPYKAAMIAARDKLAGAYEAYNASEWSIEWHVTLDALESAYIAARAAYRNNECIEEIVKTFDATDDANVKAQQAVNAFRNTYGK